MQSADIGTRKEASGAVANCDTQDLLSERIRTVLSKSYGRANIVIARTTARSGRRDDDNKGKHILFLYRDCRRTFGLVADMEKEVG